MVHLSNALRDLGLTVWFDASLEPGSSFDEEIMREVTSARAVIVCWSKGSVVSRWVRSEAMIGASRLVLVPVFLETCTLMPPFNIEHTEDLSDWTGEAGHGGWQKVAARLGALTARGEALSRWLAAEAAGTAEPYREFLKRCPTDPLATTAKERIWSLELAVTRRRLADELGLEIGDEPVAGQRIQALRAEIEDLRARSGATETAVRSANERARQAEAKVVAAEDRQRQAEDRAQQADSRAAVADAREREALEVARAASQDAADARATRQVLNFQPIRAAIIIVLGSVLLGMATLWIIETGMQTALYTTFGYWFWRVPWAFRGLVIAMVVTNMLILVGLWHRAALPGRLVAALVLWSSFVIIILGVAIESHELRLAQMVYRTNFYSAIFTVVICVWAYGSRWRVLFRRQTAIA